MVECDSCESWSMYVLNIFCFGTSEATIKECVRSQPVNMNPLSFTYHETVSRTFDIALRSHFTELVITGERITDSQAVAIIIREGFYCKKFFIMALAPTKSFEIIVSRPACSSISCLKYTASNETETLVYVWNVISMLWSRIYTYIT